MYWGILNCEWFLFFLFISDTFWANWLQGTRKFSGSKEKESIFNNSAEIFSHSVKITWRGIHSPVLESHIWALSLILRLFFPYVQKKFRSFLQGAGGRDIRWNPPKLHTGKLQGWLQTDLPTQETFTCSLHVQRAVASEVSDLVLWLSS